jgi:protein TonB
MELLMALPGGAFPDRMRRSGRFAIGASIGVHAVLIVGALALPAARPAPAAPPITVDIVSAELPAEPPPPPREAPPPAARPVQLRQTIARRVAIAPPPEAPAAVPPTPTAEPTSETAPVVEPAPAAAPAPTGPAALVAAGAARGAVGPIGAAVGSGPSEAQRAAPRSAMVGRYRELLRGRIRDGFRYPEEARELELTGEVIVQVMIDRAGRLVGARLRGACPHALLCDHALRTVRAAAPFAPLPPELGEALQVELPLAYTFE